MRIHAWTLARMISGTRSDYRPRLLSQLLSSWPTWLPMSSSFSDVPICLSCVPLPVARIPGICGSQALHGSRVIIKLPYITVNSYDRRQHSYLLRSHLFQNHPPFQNPKSKLNADSKRVRMDYNMEKVTWESCPTQVEIARRWFRQIEYSRYM